jgi:NAD(P)-dependent dehydrogenase (short-subunit alcohol dehydrogenase family)
MARLRGKVAVVTGAARGIGRGHAMLLAEEGASVVVNDLGGEWDGTGADQRPAQLVVDEIVAAGGNAVANYDDVSDWEGGQRLVNQAIEAFGDLDILICNAGILRDRMTFNMTEEEWDAVIRVHLKGHFVPIRWASTYWRERNKETGELVDGRVVLTSSESGLFANPGQLNYDAAKSGIATMAVVLAKELARYGVTVNAIAPRARTRLTENTFGVRPAGEGEFDARDPDNVAPWVVWLCTEAAAHITGQNFVVGGGTVQLVSGWKVESTIDKPARWTLDELDDRWRELFGDLPTAPLQRPSPPSPPPTSDETPR